MRALVFLLLVGVGLAGCAEDAAEGTAETGLAADPAPDFDALFDASSAIDWWTHISTAYPKHDSWTPMNDMIREHLVAELQGIGMDVEVRSYAATPRDAASDIPGELPMTPVTEIHAVVATKTGTWAAQHPDEPDRRIGLVSHYDTQAGTVYGAYDDKSGTAAQFHICKALMEVELNKTVSCIFFDAEEQGLLASKRYVEDIQDETDEYVYDFVLGYDMTGINWPGHDWKMYVMTGGADHVPYLKALAERVMHLDLGYPMDGVEVLDTHDRNSDEMNFKRAGIPIYRFAGGRHAADYPQYHMPLDTVDYVYDFVDGRENFEAGLSTVVEGSFHLILALDGTDAETLARDFV